MKPVKYLLTTSFLSLCVFHSTAQAEDDAAAASATGSVTVPSKGAPKAAQANTHLRTLHIAIHKHGFTADVIKSFGIDNLVSQYKAFGSSKFAEHKDLALKGHSLDDITTYGADFLREIHNNPLHEGKSLDEILATAKELHNDLVADPELLIKDAEILALSRYANSYDSSNAQFQNALILAKTLLTDKTLTSTSDLSSSISVATIASESGYNLAFVRLLSAYGALGSNGENIAGEILGADYSGYSNDGSLSTMLQNSTGDYLSFLSSLTGSRSFSDEDSTSSILDVPLSNIELSAASTITLGSADSDTTIDVSSKLQKASTTADRKVFIVGAAKDLKSAGNIKFTNTNTVEDHALVLGAADDVFIENTNIEYTGSNLGIGSGDTGSDSMWLVNTSISTGGNLAVGSLGTINITGGSTFTVGNANSGTSDPDNVYLYANDLINIDSLAFSGRVDDIYMESKTIHVKNTTFPSTAEVMLRSQSGALKINNTSNDFVVGAVNLHNVKHLGIGNNVLTDNDFQGTAGHTNSKSTLPNGTPFIRVRGQ